MLFIHLKVSTINRVLQQIAKSYIIKFGLANLIQHYYGNKMANMEFVIAQLN